MRMDPGTAYRCRACSGVEVEPLMDLGRMPIAHRLLTRSEEDFATFPFRLSLCRACGLLQVVEPIDPDLLYRSFNYNFSSWKPEPHRADEIGWLHERVAARSVAEIGANDGLFLDELRATGIATLAGIEPNPASGTLARARGLAIAEGMASVATAQRLVAEHGRFDLVVARQVLEHVPDVATFFATAHALVRDDGWLFIDVPDMQPAADLGDCSVLWEEHVSYYTRPTLEALLRRNGFEPVEVRTYDFSGGALAVLARRRAGPLPAASDDPRNVERGQRFALRVESYRRRLGAALDRAREQGIGTAIYGAGVRACMLTNGLQLSGLRFAIDDQSERQGKFLPGSRLPIRSADALSGGEPLIVVLAVNNENEARVEARIAELAGSPVLTVSACGPRDIWDELGRLEAFAGLALPA